MLALVIDDSRPVRMIIGQILREFGMDVLEAGDGTAALELVERHPGIELILVDWNMPNMNGLDFIRTIRADEAYRGVQILMVTSESHSAQVMEAMNAGANEYLMKPFNKEILAAKLNLMDVL